MYHVLDLSLCRPTVRATRSRSRSPRPGGGRCARAAHRPQYSPRSGRSRSGARGAPSRVGPHGARRECLAREVTRTSSSSTTPEPDLPAWWWSSPSGRAGRRWQVSPKELERSRSAMAPPARRRLTPITRATPARGVKRNSPIEKTQRSSPQPASPQSGNRGSQRTGARSATHQRFSARPRAC